MKILHLQIKNLASIEQADIDFENGPLARDPLFLICGETGSGKTTILNAISLALYAQVPSLANVSSKEKTAETDVSANSPVILMRRGAKDAEAALTFEVASRRYKATWKAHRKRTGKYETAHSVEDLTDHSVESGKAAVKQRLQQLVGLSFEQFTRTTLLAQGDFAAFLKARADEKVEILEKLTGTEIYSLIGKQIYTHMQQADTQVKTTLTRIGDARLLDEQERAQQAATIERAQQRLPALDSRLQALHTAVEWLKRHAELNEKEKTAVTACNAAHLTAESDENRTALLTLARWDATTEVRALLSDIDSKRKEIAEAKSRIESLEQRDWHAVDDGLAWLVLETARIKALAIAVQAKIDEQEPLQPVYSRIPKIAEEARAVSDKLVDADNCRKQAEILKHDAEAARQKLIPLERQVEAAETAYAQAQAMVQTCTAEADNDDIDLLRRQMDACTKRLSDIDLACREANALDQARIEVELTAAELDSRRRLLDHTAAKLELDRQTLAAARTEYQNCQAMLDGQKELKDHIDSMRRLFAETSTCPLCGTSGVHLHSDDTVDGVLRASQERADKARNLLDTAEKAVNEGAATAGVLTREVQRIESTLTSRRTALDKVSDAFAQACADAGADTSPLPDSAALSAMAREARLAHEQADHEMQAANGRRDRLTQAHRQLARCAKAREDALASLRKCTDTVGSLLSQAGYNAERAATIDKEADECFDRFTDLFAVSARAEQAVISRLAGKGISIKRESARTIATEVERMHADYRQLADEHECLSRRIETLEAESSRVQAALVKCRELHLPAPYTAMPDKTADLADKAETLYRELYAALSMLDNNTRDLEQKRRKCDSFFASSDIPADQVEALRGISRHDIDQWRQSTLAHEKALRQAEATLKAASDLVAAHLRERPSISDDDTIETLEAEKESVEAEKTKTIADRSAAALLLDNDRRSRADKENLELQLKQEKADYMRWAKLNDLFGQSDGVKFKRVAQSYVLRMLLAKSNHYLRMLTPRYTLVCDDGSLVINVCDAHQGGVIRYAGGLSGGETFIVSLALALGLSSIGKDKIDVDTLFIDEGFGTLDQQTLDMVIDALDRLHQNVNRRVGIISHVDALKERIPTRLSVERTGASSSKIVVKSS